MNISDASTPNELSSERSDEQIDRRPRIVDGGPPRQSSVRGPASGPSIIPLANAEIHDEPNSQSCTEQSNQLTQPHPVCPAADPTLRNSGGGARQSMPFLGVTRPFVGAQTAISEPPKTSESFIEQPLVAPKCDVGGSTPNEASAAAPKNSEFCILNSDFKSFPRFPGESPRAYSAFITFFQLGHTRSLPAVTDKLDESIDAIKRWSSKFNWNDRIHAFNAGILQQQAAAEAAAQQEEAAERAARMAHFRRQEWTAAQKMLSAVECYLETCGEQQVEKMTLSQVAQALNTSSTIGRLALSASDVSETTDSAKSSLRIQFADALKRVYGQPSPRPETKNQTSSAVTPSHVQDTQSNQLVGTVALRRP